MLNWRRWREGKKPLIFKEIIIEIFIKAFKKKESMINALFFKIK
jgi:hypothetical protein